MSENYSIDERKVLLNKTASDGKKILPTDGDNLYDQQQSKKKRNIIIGVVVGILILIGIILAIVLSKKSDNSGNDPTPTPPIPPTPPPPPFVPSGFNPYYINNDTIQTDVDYFKGNIIFNDTYAPAFYKNLQMKQSDDKIGINATQIPLGINNQLSKNISFEFGQADYKVGILNIADQSQASWSIPSTAVPKSEAQRTMRLDMNNFQFSANPFYFNYSSTRGSFDTLITTKNQTLYVTQKYIQMDIQLPSQRVFGFGERQREFQLSEGTWTMWSNGQQTPYDDGTGSLQTYGVHPFALIQCKQKTEFIGLFFRNSNAQSPILTYNDDNVTSTLSYITTGGELEIYFFTKGTAKQIIANYQRVIGYPQLPPFWSLGWHSSSKMLKTLDMVKQNVDNYNKSGIPLESVWLDNYYMDNFTHFTVDNVAFKGLLDFSQNILHKNGMKLIPVVQAGLSFNDKGDTYVSEALTLNTLIMDLKNVILESQGLQNSTVFLDFFNSQSQTVWGEGLQQLYSLMNFDGLWLDMNEPTTFCNGSYPICNSNIVSEKYNYTDKIYKKIQDLQQKFLQQNQNLEDIDQSWYTSNLNQSQNTTYYLPFIPSNKWNLDNMTLSLNASNSRNNYTQYNTHSLFGHMQSQASYNYLSSENSSLNSTFYDQRLFLQSRSTFAGSGKYVSHSLGENHRTFQDLKLSIAGVMNFNMFGIPLVGPNICGFISYASSDEESELCGRWIQLSTFYPFARINGDNFTDGNLIEPYNLNGTYMTMAKSSIIERFKYMAFMYTCLFQASQEGKTCFDPLFFHYPTIDNSFYDIESTFIVGDALKVSPVLQPMNGQTEYSAFFPQGSWVSMKNLSDVVVVVNTNGENVTLTAPEDTINVHLRPGYIVPVQNNTVNGFNVNLTSQLKNNPISLIVNRDENNHAEGRLMIDNDNTISSISNQSYEYYEFQLFGNSLNVINMNPSSYVYHETDLQNIQIANAPDLENVTSACYVYKNTRSAVKLDFTWANNTLVLMYNKNDSSQHIKIAGLRQIIFATDNELNLCTLSSNWTEQLPNNYYWDSLLDLSQVESSATLKSSVNFLKDLTLTARVLKNNILNIYWTFADGQTLERTPFEVPINIINANKSELSTQNLSNFILQVNQTGLPFLQIVNKQNNSVLNINSLVLTEYFNFINSNVIVSGGANFKGIMGLSERVSNDVFLGTGVYSLWARDAADPVETGAAPGNNMYGTHPFYMAKSTDNSWFGVFTNLANAQDWYVNNFADVGIVNLTSYATGGVADIYIMYGQDPNEVTVQYQSIVGTPVLTPQWALGWNQCKWGYKSTQELKDVVNNYSASGIPLDTIWSDIDYLANYRDFHYDDENGFADQPDFVQNDLHKQNMHWIPIIDAGIAQRQGYDAYDDGMSQNIFLKSFDNQTVFTGQVWPDDAVFPDFFNQDAETYWQTYIGKLQAKIAFDGLWLDMNEASNFCDGACYADQIAPSPVQYKLPYLPSLRNLETKSIALDSIHQGGILELDAHSLFGTMQSRAAHLWFKQNDRRTMIIQRSAYAGLGKFASRWLGDNWSLNEYMGYSVTGVMMHNVLGITLAGSDICGFIGNTNPELCARWHVVGSFYPFSRNHNNWGQTPQEPYLFTEIYEGTTLYSDIMRQAIYNKYQMVRYYYTQMGLISQNGGALYKPLFFEFPNDINAYQNQTDNIMLGSALKLSVLSTTIGQNQSVFYFPQGTWCQVFNTSAHSDSCIIAPAEGLNLTLSTLAYQFYVHLRNGYIVPMQNASYLKIKTTTDLQQKPVDLHIHPSLNSESKNYEAAGTYLNDDGLVLDYEGKQNVYQMSYSHTDNTLLTLTPTLTKSAYKVNGGVINMNDALGRVEIYNAQNLTLTSNYTVAASFSNSTQYTFNNIAQFNVSSQRLQFEVDSNIQINLPELTKLQFTISA